MYKAYWIKPNSTFDDKIYLKECSDPKHLYSELHNLFSDFRDYQYFLTDDFKNKFHLERPNSNINIHASYKKNDCYIVIVNDNL